MTTPVAIQHTMTVATVDGHEHEATTHELDSDITLLYKRSP